METQTTSLPLSLNQVERVIYNAIRKEFDSYRDQDGNPPTYSWLHRKALEYGDISLCQVRNFIIGSDPPFETSLSMYMLALNMRVWDNSTRSFVDPVNVDLSGVVMDSNIRHAGRLNKDNRILFRSLYKVWRERYCQDGQANYETLLRMCKSYYPKTRPEAVIAFLEGQSNPREGLLNVLMMALRLDIKPVG